MAFPADGGIEVAVSARSLLCPPGWAGIVDCGDAATVTVPTGDWARVMRERLRGLPVEILTDSDRLRTVLPFTEVLGPASLAYLDEYDFRPAGLDTIDVAPANAPKNIIRAE
ncbi:MULTISPECIES: hypothetical protein [unclassified Micromonospora]|uniref:hypothetical protein n=1 Tax=unclassified Micromonospora TaxID=2617518 RepID=UPI0036386D15